MKQIFQEFYVDLTFVHVSKNVFSLRWENSFDWKLQLFSRFSSNCGDITIQIRSINFLATLALMKSSNLKLYEPRC